MPRTTKRIGPLSLASGAAGQTLDTATEFEIPEDGNFWVQCVIDGGSYTTAPADTPVGAWQLWLQGDESVPYARYTAAETGTNSLAGLAPSGNTLVNAIANFERMPARKGKIVYGRTSGGAAARATLIIGKGR
jgi:hypothetical protein